MRQKKKEVRKLFDRLIIRQYKKTVENTQLYRTHHRKPNSRHQRSLWRQLAKCTCQTQRALQRELRTRLRNLKTPGFFREDGVGIPRVLLGEEKATDFCPLDVTN